MENFWKKLERPIIALAPMAGITDQPFRQICKSFGVDVMYSEMASATAIFYDSQKSIGIARFNQKESPYIVQLFGSKPEHFKFAAKIIAKQIRPDGIDINFGCPAKKVISCGSGAVLMGDLKLSREIVESTLEAVNEKLPVSIKIRSEAKGVTAEEFVSNIKDLPLGAIMVHGRTLGQLFSGEVDRAVIKNIVNMVDFPVLANGGILKPEDAKKMLDETGAAGVGIAQGCLGKPWIFKQIKDYLAIGKYAELDFNEVAKVALRHAELMEKKEGPQGIIEMRKHLAWYFKGFRNASDLRQKLVHVKDMEEIKEILEKWKI